MYAKPTFSPSKEISEEAVRIATARFVTIPLATAIIGLTQSAIRSKIAQGVWTLNKHYRMGPDNRVYIDMEAFEKWVMGK